MTAFESNEEYPLIEVTKAIQFASRVSRKTRRSFTVCANEAFLQYRYPKLFPCLAWQFVMRTAEEEGTSSEIGELALAMSMLEFEFKMRISHR
jgi:hypothetical protein